MITKLKSNATVMALEHVQNLALKKISLKKTVMAASMCSSKLVHTL